MTVGEKIKDIRRRFGLSQEELSEKLNVSRQAITKWESDNGLPDTENLLQLSAIFGITIDYLLDNKRELPLLAMKEKIDLNNYNKTQYKDKYEAVLKSKFPNPWVINVLTRKNKMNKLVATFDFIIGAGTVDLADALRDMSPYYLLTKNNIQLIVNIKKDYIQVSELLNDSNKKTFTIENNKFIKTNIKI